jgi:DeoR family transcriptional regulator, fructose operon transcriptional repressor
LWRTSLSNHTPLAHDRAGRPATSSLTRPRTITIVAINIEGFSAPRRDRQLLLLRTIRERGALEVADAATLTGASLETIRRDMRSLEEQGVIRRHHGIAHPIESGAYETALAFRETNNADEKARIATNAVEHLGDAQTIFLDEGFQTQLIAARLPESRHLTVVTSSLPIANMLAPRSDVQVIILGGRLRRNTLGIVDHWAADMLRTFNIDLAFVGANGISVDHGLSTPDPSVAVVKTAAVKAARRRIFVGAHHKFASRTFIRFAEVDDFDILITGRELSQSHAFPLVAAGAHLVRV